MLEAMTAPDPTPIELRDPFTNLTATVHPHAGMLISSLRAGEVELLGQRRGLEAYLRDGKTMGIPLLYPWANRLGREQFEVAGVALDLRGDHPGLRRDPNGLPIHGLLAAHPGWIVEERPGAEPGSGAQLVASLDFGDHPDLLAAFPFPHVVRYSIGLVDLRLQLTIAVTPTGDVPVPVAHGLHPYLTIPGVPRAQWQVERPALERLLLDERGLPTGAVLKAPAWRGTLDDRTFDDAYAGTTPDPFAVAGGGYRISTTFSSGFPAAQVFAPADDDVICFEPMAASTDALTTGRGLRLVQPGETDRATVEIAVSSAPRG